MDIKEAKAFVESLRMRDSSLKEENTLFLDCSQFYSLEEVKLSMKIESTKETLVKPIVICHVEDEAKVLFELWKKYTTEEKRLVICDCDGPYSPSRPSDLDILMEKPVKQMSMLFISRQRNMYKLLSDALAELMVPHRTRLAPFKFLESKFPSVECAMSSSVYELLGKVIKEISKEENVYIDNTAKDYRDERVVRFVMNEDIDIIFIDEFVWPDEKTK